ncbi:nuclear transport factor 2 family protein [Amycolatopsis sp. NPDC059027]|uniref:nuclear transport factor 2 family protein n=1 Tax=Amycolatopsis sp. NPDC059027 TaxID=3346709 RepID=UPI003670EDE5
MTRTVSEIAQLVRQGMESIDASPMAELFAEDAVYEFPFSSGGMPQRFEGRDAIMTTLAAGGVRARQLGLEKVQVATHLTDSGFVVELIAEGRSVDDGTPYRFPSSVGVLTVADGQITHYRDYPNYAGAAEVMGAGAKPRSDAHQVFDKFLTASVENRWDDVADLYAEDVVIELPFTIPGVPRVTQGREELRARFKAVGEARRLIKAEHVVVHETVDPAVIVAEFDLHNEVLSDGSTFTSSYVMVLTARDGRIVRSRDYTDTAAAIERTAAFRASLSGSSAD